jgi:hypothetical protein
MPEWAIGLIGVVVGLLLGIEPVQLNIRNESKKRTQDAVRQLLGRIYGISDAVQYSLNEAERGETASIGDAVHLTGELPEEVGQALVLLPKDARPHAQDVSATLRNAGILLDSLSKVDSKEERTQYLQLAQNAYQESRDALHKLGEALEVQTLRRCDPCATLSFRGASMARLLFDLGSGPSDP